MATITIQSTTVPDYTRGGTAATLRVYATGPFFDSDGIEHVPGQGGIYKSVACTVSGTTVTIPEFTLPSTTDSSDDSVRYTAVLFDQNGGRVGALMGGIEFFVSEINTNPRWVDIYTTNQATLRSMPDGFYTNHQTDFLLSLKQDALVSGTNIKTVNGESLLGAGDLEILPGAETLLSTYASLPDAIADIGATPTVLVIDEASTLSTALTVPATTTLRQLGTHKITKSGTGAIEFEGTGLFDPESLTPLFSGFATGDITFTGTAPVRLSASLWDDADLDAKLARAIAAVTGKPVTIVAHPGEITAKVTLTEGLRLHCTAGVYTNSIPAWGTGATAFILESNTVFYGDGMFATIFEESSNDNPQIIRASSVESGPFDGDNENIEIRDFQVRYHAGTAPNSVSSAVFGGNCRNGVIERVYFNRVQAFGAYWGGHGSSGHYAENCWIRGCIFEGLQTQNAGLISGRNNHIVDNIFIVSNLPTSAYVAVIDLEPNEQTDIMENPHIEGNTIDGTWAQQNFNGIQVQVGSSFFVRGGRILNNSIYGSPVLDLLRFDDTNVDAATDTITIYNHGLKPYHAIHFRTYGSLPGGLVPAYGQTYYAIVTGTHTFKLATSYANAVAGTAIDITAVAGSGNHYIEPSAYCITGIYLVGAVGTTVEGNAIHGGSQYGLIIDGGRLNSVKGNRFMTSATPIFLQAVSQTEVEGNDAIEQGFFTQTDDIREAETQIPITAATSGSPYVTLPFANPWWNGLTVDINGSEYDVWAATNPLTGTLKLNTNAAHTLAAKTFADADVNTGTDEITIASHGFETGGTVKLSTTGAVPTGLVTNTIYYAIKTGANTLKLASTRALADAGTAIDITAAAGGGTHTLTPQMETRFSSNRYRNNRMTVTLAPQSDSEVDPVQIMGDITIHPATVEAGTVSLQTFSLPGVEVGDAIVLNPPAAGLDAGLTVGQVYVSAADVIAISFENPTDTDISPVSAVWKYTLTR